MTDLKTKFNYPANPELVNKVTDFIKKSKEPELFRINVYGLADSWGQDRRELLELFIRGLNAGIFQMEWIFHCTSCGGPAQESHTIHDAMSTGVCGGCGNHFSNKLDDNIEVFFTIHPEVRPLKKEIKEKYMKELMDGLLKTKILVWKKPTVIHGVDIVQNPVYRELMGEEVLLPDQSLEIMKTTILFTDIKGSTQLYTDLGDSKAFSIVREHFRILFEVIKKYHGVPVKTIGDAVMGSFTTQTEALEAALEAQKRLIEYYETKPEDERIEVKIGLHTGTTLIVTLNGRLDYFGTTVNMAARIQGRSNPHEVVISQQLFDHPENKRIIKKYVDSVVKAKTEFKGLNGEFIIYHIVMK